jgi:hypothetical protein
VLFFKGVGLVCAGGYVFAVGRGGAARRLPIAGKAPAACLDAAGAHEQTIPKTRDTTSRNSLGVHNSRVSSPGTKIWTLECGWKIMFLAKIGYFRFQFSI